MAWIESHQELARHPKTRRLARELGISVPAVIGHLHLLWWWAMDYAQDGDLSRYEAPDIAEAVLWEGDAQAFVDALMAVGFIDEADLCIHDWDEYAGRLLDKRRANAERMRTVRAHASHVSDTCGATVPYRTVQNTTEQNTTVPTATASVRAGARGEDKPSPILFADMNITQRKAYVKQRLHSTVPGQWTKISKWTEWVLALVSTPTGLQRIVAEDATSGLERILARMAMLTPDTSDWPDAWGRTAFPPARESPGDKRVRDTQNMIEEVVRDADERRQAQSGGDSSDG